MSWVKCKCGEYLGDVDYPNAIEGGIITEMEMDGVEDNQYALLEIQDLMRTVWECPKCGRLAIAHPDKNGRGLKWYAPEDKKPGNLMRKMEDI